MPLLHYGFGFLALSQWLVLALLCLVHDRRLPPGPLAGLVALGLLLTLGCILAGALHGAWHGFASLGSLVLFAIALVLNLASLAREAGFVSLSSFNKAFVEIHGMTPSRFRDRIRPGSGGVGEP